MKKRQTVQKELSISESDELLQNVALLKRVVEEGSAKAAIETEEVLNYEEQKKKLEERAERLRRRTFDEKERFENWKKDYEERAKRRMKLSLGLEDDNHKKTNEV